MGSYFLCGGLGASFRQGVSVMTKPLDKYDLHEWAIDAKGCWALAIAEIRKAGVIAGRYQPINDEERAWLNQS